MGKLNDKNYSFTVDTGSSHTLVHTDLIPDRYLETAESKLYGITGHSTKLFGPINVKLDIAGLAVDHPVYATKMSEKVILGLDFMTKYDCTIDLLCMTMSIGGNKIQLQKLYGIQKINNSGTIVQVKAYNVIDHNALMHNKETKELPCHVQDLYESSEDKLNNDNDKLKVKENPEGQRARWIAKLDQYSYDIQQSASIAHGNADSLSRRPCAKYTHCYKWEEKSNAPRCKCLQASTKKDSASDQEEDYICFKEAQREDKDLNPIIRKMEESSLRPTWEQVSHVSPTTKCYWAQWDMLRLKDGILQHKWVNNDGSLQCWQTVVPRSSKPKILEEHHNSVRSGHLGMRKTLSKLRQQFYWLGMRHDVEEWCRSCDTCCAKKGPHKRGRAPLKLYQVGAPMERVAVDITGPLPVTSSGNRYICVAMDYFTKWPEAYAIPDQEATTVAKALVEQFFSRLGIPKELHSDQGRNFESAVFRECCRLLGIRKTRTTPGHPESDGMVERYNRTLADELAKYCIESQQDWDLKLPLALMAYRSSEHESTGYSPARLMTGRELRLPVDLITDSPPGEETAAATTQYVKDLKGRLYEIHHQVRENLNITGQAMKERYDLSNFSM